MLLLTVLYESHKLLPQRMVNSALMLFVQSVQKVK